MSGDNSFFDPLSLGSQIITNVVIAISVVSGFAVSVFLKIKSAMQKSRRESVQTAASLLENYVIPILEESSKLAETTKKQEIKFKQLGDVVYEEMGAEKANQITNKPEIKQVNMAKDIEEAAATHKLIDEKIANAKALRQKLDDMIAEHDKEYHSSSSGAGAPGTDKK